MTIQQTAPPRRHDLARAVTYETLQQRATEEPRDGARRRRGRFERVVPAGRPRPAHDGRAVSIRTAARRTHRLALTGQLEHDTAATLEAEIDALCASGIEELILDLGGLHRLDSTGLQVLAMRCALCAKRGTVVRIEAVSPELQPVLVAAGLASHLGSGEAFAAAVGARRR